MKRFTLYASLANERVWDEFFANQITVADLIQYVIKHGANDFDNPPQESILSNVVAFCDRFIVTIDPAYKVFDIFECNNQFRFR